MEQNFMHLLNCGTSPTVITHKKLFNKIAVSLEYFKHVGNMKINPH
jgi:hypothetical protein